MYGEIANCLFGKWPEVQRKGELKIFQFEISTFNMILSRVRVKQLEKCLLGDLLILS